MMNVSDIIQLVVLCALIFFPLGYYTRHYSRRIRDAARIVFSRPRYVNPAGTLNRASQQGKPKK